MKEMNKTVVYFHICATTNQVVYVGIGDVKRPYVKVGRSKFWSNYTNKYGYYVQVMHTDLSWEKACELEKEYIKQFGRRDLGLGNLLNMTAGGEGRVDAVVTESTRRKMARNQAKRIQQLDLDGNVIATYEMALDAAKESGIYCSNISNCCKGKRKTCGGFRWRYA